MKILFTITLLISFYLSTAQKLLEITYEEGTYNLGRSFISLSDSGKQFYFMKSEVFGDPVTKMKQKKIVHHSTITIQDSAASWSEVGYPGKTELLIKSDFPEQNWIIYPQTKKILGYLCQVAIMVNEKKDTTLVWFTDSLGNYFAKNYAYTAPGVVLEMQQQIKSLKILIHYTATKIRFTTGKIIFPDETAVLTKNAWEKYQKGKKTIGELNSNPNAPYSKIKYRRPS